jgi:hypothetical protein
MCLPLVLVIVLTSSRSCITACRTHVTLDEDNDTIAVARPDKYVAPIEAEAQMKLLWDREGLILSLIFGSARGAPLPHESDPVLRIDSNGYKLFFIHTLAVPPSRFRPPMALGDVVAEHPQNVYLAKVCVCILSLSVQHQTSDSDDSVNRCACTRHVVALSYPDFYCLLKAVLLHFMCIDVLSGNESQ